MKRLIYLAILMASTAMVLAQTYDVTEPWAYRAVNDSTTNTLKPQGLQRVQIIGHSIASSNAIPVSATVNATVGGMLATNGVAIEMGDAIGTDAIFMFSEEGGSSYEAPLAVMPLQWNGASWDRFTGNGTNVISNNVNLSPTNSILVSGYSTISYQSLTCDTSGVYGAGDQWATKTTASLLRAAGKNSVITSVALISMDDSAPAITLLLFRASYTTNANNSPWQASAGDYTNLIQAVSIASADYVDLGTNRIANKTSLNIPVSATTGTDIYLGFIAQDTQQITNAPKLVIGAIQD